MKGIFAAERVNCFKKWPYILFIGMGINFSLLSWEIIEDKNLSFEQLNNFKHVSIVFAGQNLDTPVSSFGHTFLIFHNQTTPEPNSIIFEYLGGDQDKFFEARALFSSVGGAFFLRLWERKLWEYEKEGRDIWIFPIELKDHEREKLQSQIKILLKSKHPYNFFFKNCSWYIFKTVQESMDDMQCSVKFYVIPTDTLHSLYKCKKIKSPLYLPSGATRLFQSLKKLNSKEKKVFKDITSSTLNKNLNFGEVSTPAKQALTEWIDYTIPRTNEYYIRDKLFNLKKDYHLPGHYHKKLQSVYAPGNSRITLLQESDYTTLTFVPAQTRFLKPVDSFFWADQFEVMTTSISYRSKRLTLSQWNILDISTNTSKNMLEFPFAKEIYLGYQKYHLNTNTVLKTYSTLIGGGVSYDLMDGWKWMTSIFIEGGIGTLHEKKNSFFGPGISSKMFIRFGNIMRLKVAFQQMIKRRFFIDRKLNFQFIFYDRSPFVGAVDYFSFKMANHTKMYDSWGLSLSYLF